MFNFEAFKEAWINACVHNKWVDGIPPAIYWFKDRVEIISYGGISKGLTKEEFLSGKTQPVNKELMNIFLQCDIVEQSGHGVPLIVKEYGEKAYRFSENSITVVIPFDRIGFGKDFHEEIDGNDAIIGVDDAINDAITNENDAIMGTDDAISDAITNENDAIMGIDDAISDAINEVNGAENALGGAKSGAINDASGAENTLGGVINGANGAENTLGGAINGAINGASGAKNIIEEKIKNHIL